MLAHVDWHYGVGLVISVVDGLFVPDDYTVVEVEFFFLSFFFINAY